MAGAAIPLLARGVLNVGIPPGPFDMVRRADRGNGSAVESTGARSLGLRDRERQALTAERAILRQEGGDIDGQAGEERDAEIHLAA